MRVTPTSFVVRVYGFDPIATSGRSTGKLIEPTVPTAVVRKKSVRSQAGIPSPGTGRRRILHFNVTDHPSAEWTLQQLREGLPGDHPFRFLIHDRDGIFSRELDIIVADMGVSVVQSTQHGFATHSIA